MNRRPRPAVLSRALPSLAALGSAFAVAGCHHDAAPPVAQALVLPVEMPAPPPAPPPSSTTTAATPCSAPPAGAVAEVTQTAASEPPHLHHNPAKHRPPPVTHRVLGGVPAYVSTSGTPFP